MAEIPSFEAPFTVAAQLEARAAHPEISARVAIRAGDRHWTWRRFRDESVRMAHLLRRRLGACSDARPGHVAMLLDNHPELLALAAGCAYARLTLFGVNTGLRGDSLAGVIDQSRARVLVVGERLLPELLRVRARLRGIPDENLLVLRAGDAPAQGARDLESALAEEVAEPGASLAAPPLDARPEDNLVVIYTSGTTGLPKGINNNHFKLLAIGQNVAQRLRLDPDDVGYACMPLFHSNSLFLGFQPAFHVGASLLLRERFSASAFVPDVLGHGVSFWNYVGEPVHYVLEAIRAHYADDEARIAAELTADPRNRLRWALGNGASPPDIDRFVRWLGLEDMFELYGSTEAAISTFRVRGDPRGSVGEIADPNVRILDERGAECPPAHLGEDGRVVNYAEAVGEICRVAGDTALFQGYFDDAEANRRKHRAGVYHSGDLGHVLVLDGRRFLYFDGRTDDWIRKDGENFSAAQVARLLQEHPDVALAAAYGVPCAVSDELVMAALLLRPGARFDPAGFHAFCERQVEGGGMDRKWFPDFVRVVPDFEFTETQKVLVRGLKRVHFDRRRLPEAEIYWRERGNAAFRPFAPEDFERLRREFAAAERAHLLDA